jgi:uncharacterized protein YbgA (DUF1722 family)/uncharacterized protein YbbK (DUF523 family)
MSERLSHAAPPTAERPIRIGVSACLLGHEVRFDGQHKRNDFLCDTLGGHVEWVPVCPEVELGLGIPRDTLRLVAGPRGPELIAQRTGRALTQEMNTFSAERVRQLVDEDLSGYVLKKDSPSCGLQRVKVYAGLEKGVTATRDGRGLFAAALVAQFPDLPIEEEGRLNDPRLRENFIERVFAYHRLQQLFASRWTLGQLVQFHSAHKLTLLAHTPRGYQELGRLVAVGKTMPRATLRQRYQSGFMAALAQLATVGRHVNVLQHIAGYFREQLDPADRRELESLIEDFRRELVPLIVPITLVRHHARRLGIEYILGQVYLEPHPKELMLCNHV